MCPASCGCQEIDDAYLTEMCKEMTLDAIEKLSKVRDVLETRTQTQPHN